MRYAEFEIAKEEEQSSTHLKGEEIVQESRTHSCISVLDMLMYSRHHMLSSSQR